MLGKYLHELEQKQNLPFNMSQLPTCSWYTYSNLSPIYRFNLNFKTCFIL